MKPRALRLVTVLASTLIGLCLAELVARKTYGEGFNILVDPYEDHSYRPLLEYAQTWGDLRFRFYTNSLGWKDSRPGRVIEKRSPRPRVVFLGDSFTEGLGYPQEQTLSGYAESFLNSTAERFEVLNGGRASYSPILEYQRLKRFLAGGYHADTVVLLYDVSDPQDEIYYSSRYDFSATGEPLRFKGWSYHPFLRALYNHSALVRSLRRLTQARQDTSVIQKAKAEASLQGGAAISGRELLQLSPGAYRALRSNWPLHPPSLAGWAEEGLLSSFRNLLRIERLTRRHGIRFLIVIYPGPQMLYTRDDPRQYAVLKQTFPQWFADREAVYGDRPGPEISAYQRRVHEFCREHGIELLDLIPEIREVSDPHRLYIPGDVHFNRRGNRLVGRRIAEALFRSAA